MSMTSGPVVPENTGNSSDLPSGSLREADLSAMVFPCICFRLSGSEPRHYILEVGLVDFAAPGDDVPQVVVGQVEEGIQLVRLMARGRRVLEVALQDNVQLQQASPAL